jgi:hypothetical protein
LIGSVIGGILPRQGGTLAKMPPEIVEKLAAIGIRDPIGSCWRRGKPCFEHKFCFMEWVCWCGGEPKRVTMVPFK